MYNPVIFKDRVEAGKRLGQKLKKLKIKDPFVLAIPSGGVPVGKEIAKILNCPLDLLIVRKIQFPWTTEAGFGAIAADGTVYLGPTARDLSQAIIKRQSQKAQEEVKQREKLFLKGRKRPNLKDKTVILVDDGLAAGSTMFTAIQLVNKKKPVKIIVATPTASAGAVNLIKKLTDQIIALYRHPKNLPFAVASSYEKWHDLTDEEVLEYLDQKKHQK